MSPGFAGTQLVVDPINKITLFVGAPRLHNRIYQISKNQVPNIKIDSHNIKHLFYLMVVRKLFVVIILKLKKFLLL